MNTTNSGDHVLVAGATGILGGEICRQLRDQNKAVRALVRQSSDENKTAALKAGGVGLFVGDLKDKTSLLKALQGVTAIISTVSASFSRQDGDSIQTVDEVGQLNLVDAAKEAGVDKFVYISFCHMPLDFPLQAAKRTVEQHIMQSGLDYTILQPTYFMEIWLGPALGFDFVNGKATIYGEGNSKVSWISLKDVAAFAVASLNNPAAVNATIPLGGPEAMSALEVVQVFEDTLNKKFELQHVPGEALKEQFAVATDPLARSFAGLVATVAAGSVVDMNGLPEGFPQRLTSVREYAQSVT